MCRLLPLLLCICLGGLAPLTQAAPKADRWDFWAVSDEQSHVVIDHQLWQRFLDAHLSADASGINRLAYASVSPASRQQLDLYIRSLAKQDPRRLNRQQQMAYWINLYNALTVQLVLKHYPVQSITKIRRSWFGFGPWDFEIVTIASQSLSLNDIEHRILRPIWRDPRIHFAVNCASVGCPNLSQRVYDPKQLDLQLQQAASDYLKHPRGAHFEGRQLVLSSIFDWYQGDFGRNSQAMLETLANFASPELAVRLRNYRGDIEYEYDWTLNQAE